MKYYTEGTSHFKRKNHNSEVNSAAFEPLDKTKNEVFETVQKLNALSECYKKGFSQIIY